MSRAGFAFTVCLVGLIVAGCNIENVVKKQLQKAMAKLQNEMADLQKKTQKQLEAVQKKAEKDAALAQERAEEIRAKAQEEITQIQQKSNERIRELEARLEKDKQAFLELHEDDRKYPPP